MTSRAEAAAAPEPGAMRKLSRAIDGLGRVLAYYSGAAFFVLSLYITYDALARYFGFFYSGISDEISSYVLGVAGVWGMAYGLQVGAHVRIDLLINHAGPSLRRALDMLAGGVTMLFAALLAFYAWAQAAEAYELGTRSITVLRAPLAIPQGLIAFGYTLLAVQALSLLLRGLAPVAEHEAI
jgi:TRAP-type C4-dicarboxylate transport system permease small subunit